MRVYALPWRFGPIEFAHTTPDQKRLGRARNKVGESYLKPDFQADFSIGFDRLVPAVLLEK